MGSNNSSPVSSHPDEAIILEPSNMLRPSREMTEGEVLAAKINANILSEGASSKLIPGSRPGAPVREEAAALYASGRPQDAAKVLTNYMQAGKGQVEKSIWYMLFDLYQSTDQHAAFERLAILFAKAFGASPPAWEDWSSNLINLLGQNILVVEGYPSNMNSDRVSSFVNVARQAKTARLDLSRVRLEEGDDMIISLNRLREMMSRLRRYRVKTLLMGETRLVDDLKIIVSQPGAQAKAAWLLLFELLQWRGEEQTFENLAFDYAMKFEESAPGFEPDGVIAINPDDASQESGPSSIFVTFDVPDYLDANNVKEFLSSIDSRLRSFGSARLDFSKVRQVSFDAATSLASFLNTLGVSPGRVIAAHPTELVAAILEMSGALSYITIEARKR